MLELLDMVYNTLEEARDTTRLRFSTPRGGPVGTHHIDV